MCIPGTPLTWQGMETKIKSPEICLQLILFGESSCCSVKPSRF